MDHNGNQELTLFLMLPITYNADLHGSIMHTQVQFVISCYLLYCHVNLHFMLKNIYIYLL